MGSGNNEKWYYSMALSQMVREVEKIPSVQAMQVNRTFRVKEGAKFIDFGF